MTAGQEAYREYLQSDTWKTIRAQRLAMDNKECVLCGGEAKHVHHRRYPKKWGTETVNDLICLCDLCHAKYHTTDPVQQDDQPSVWTIIFLAYPLIHSLITDACSAANQVVDEGYTDTELVEACERIEEILKDTNVVSVNDFLCGRMKTNGVD